MTTMVLTAEQDKEIDAYVKAYQSAILPETYCGAATSIQRQIKNDAERTAMVASPQAQAWYDSLKKAMGAHRTGKGPDWDKIRDGKDAQLGLFVYTRIGSIFRHMNCDKGEEPTNGHSNGTNGINGMQPQLPTILDPAVILSNCNEASLQEAKRRYLALAKEYSLLPPDSIVAELWGFTRQKVNRIRKKLVAAGYEFVPAELPEWAYRDNETWWRVASRPLTEPEIKAQLAAKLGDKIQSLSSSELRTLLELLA